MLNGRLYLQAWLIAAVALLVAFLTLEPPPEDITPEAATTFDAGQAARAAEELARVAPSRAPGSSGGETAAAWVEASLNELPKGAVASQPFRARTDRELVDLRNVFYTLPATAETTSARNILIVAPRDAPDGVTAGTSSTAILLEMARSASTGVFRHPLIFLSADGGSIGNAGARWYLRSVDRGLIAGVIVLEAPGEGDGQRLHIWSGGAGKQALGLRRLAERAVLDAGGEPDPLPALRSQLIGLAVPETRGDQRAAIDLAVPAVALSGREEGELPRGDVPLERAILDRGGTAALGLVKLLDAQERAAAPDGSLAYAGKVLRPAVGRLALLLLILPVVVMALDAAARIRRARVRLSTGLRAVAWRFVVPLGILALAHVLAMLGVLRLPDAGRPPSVDALGPGLRDLLVVLLLGLIAAVAWMVVRSRVLAVGATRPAEAAGALVWLAVLCFVAWWIAPFSLVLILPAAHAALAATVAQRAWQIAALAAVAVAPSIGVVLATSAAIDRNPLFAVWYLCQTAVSGARGLAGPLLAVLVGVCVVSLGSLVVFRARKGLIAGRRPARIRAAR